MSIPGWRNSKGRKAGCLLLPSSAKSNRFCRSASTAIEIIDPADWPSLIDAQGRINMNHMVPYVLDQDGVGSCAAESSTGGLLIQRNFSGQQLVRLNPYSLYHFSGGGRDMGSNIDTNLKYLREQGVCPIDLWPRSKGYRLRPSAEAMEAAKLFRIVEFYDIRNKVEFGSALLQGLVVVYGRSGHAICAVYLKSVNRIIYLNSWGNWGNEGRGEESLGVVNWGYGAYAIRTVAHDDVPYKLLKSELAPLPKFEKYPVIDPQCA